MIQTPRSVRAINAQAWFVERERLDAGASLDDIASNLQDLGVDYDAIRRAPSLRMFFVADPTTLDLMAAPARCNFVTNVLLREICGVLRDWGAL